MHTNVVHLRVVFGLIVVPLLVVSCEKKEPSPPPLDPAIVVALQEDSFEPEIEGPIALAEVRQLAVDYVKGKMPNAEVKGVSLRPAAEKTKEFRVDVDCVVKGQTDSVIIPLVVQRFFPQRGEPYWRVSLLHTLTEQTLSQISDDAKLRRLDGLTQDAEVKDDPLGLFSPSEKRAVKKP